MDSSKDSTSIASTTIDHIRNKEIFSLYSEAHKHRELNFLPNKSNSINSLACFPRSGSSWLLNLLEGITGVFLTDDMALETSMDAVKKGNYRGCLDYVDIVRTHYPIVSSYVFRSEKLQNYEVSKSLLLVRNPLMSFVSFTAFCMSNFDHNNNLSVKEELQAKPYLLEGYTLAYKKIMQFWIEKASAKIPVKIIRYEDLQENPTDTLKEIMEFYYPNNKKYSKKVEEYVLKQGVGSTYKNKSTRTNHEDEYSTENIDFINKELKEYMELFGYTKNTAKDLLFKDFNKKQEEMHKNTSSNVIDLPFITEEEEIIKKIFA